MGIYLPHPNDKPSFEHTQRWGLNRNGLLKPDVVCLPFNEGGGNSAHDITNNGRHGVLNGALTWRNGLTFDGNEANYVSIPNMASFFASATSFTIVTETIWGSSSADETIFDMSDGTDANWYRDSIILFGDDVGVARSDIVSFFVGINSNIYRLESAAGVKAAGVKTHIGITYEAPTMRLYINGMEDANSPVTGPSAMDAGLIDDAWVGKSHSASGSQKPHQGSVNYIHADSKAHTAAEMLQYYNKPHSFFNKGFDLSRYGGVAAGDVFVTPAPVTAIASVVNPTVVLGSLNITPAPAEVIASTIDPTVVLGSVSITPAPVEVIASTIDPTVIEGGLTITPAPISAIASTIDPTVILGAIFITPAPASAVATTIAPTVVLGSLNITPAPVEAIASTVGPTVLISTILVILSRSRVAIIDTRRRVGEIDTRRRVGIVDTKRRTGKI